MNKPKTAEFILNQLINSCENCFDKSYDDEKKSYIAEAKQQFIDHMEGMKKDMSGEHTHDLVYRPPLRDGESRNITCVNYDERRGYNIACDDLIKWIRGE